MRLTPHIVAASALFFGAAVIIPATIYTINSNALREVAISTYARKTGGDASPAPQPGVVARRHSVESVP